MIKKIIFLIITGGILAGAGWYFRDDVSRFYGVLSNSAQELAHVDLEEAVSEIVREVSTPSPLMTSTTPPVKPVMLTALAVIQETNVQRAQNGGLPGLTANAQLTAAAEAKAKDMFENQYFEHNSPSGVTPAQLVESYGYAYLSTGENLILGAFASEKEAVQLWMDSPGHRANILNAKYTEIGVAMVQGDFRGQKVWIGVQEFGRPQSACPRPSRELRAQIREQKDRLEQLAIEIDQRKKELDALNPHSAQYQQKADEYNNLVEAYNALADQNKSSVAQYNAQVQAYNACASGE